MKQFNVVSYCLFLFGVLVGAFGLSEYERLAYGHQVSLLQFQQGFLQEQQYSFGSGAAFSFYTNGNYSLMYENCGTGPKRYDSRIHFSNGESVRIVVTYMMKADDGRYFASPSKNFDPSLASQFAASTIRHRAIINHSSLGSVRAKGDSVAVAKISGKYFVVYVELHDVRSFPNHAVFSLIVH